MKKRRIALLGATGSIGRSATAVLNSNSDRFEIVAVAARNSVNELAQTALKLNTPWAVTSDRQNFSVLRELLPELLLQRFQIFFLLLRQFFRQLLL